jgi:cobalt-zinc-cadmium efflux system membrane fusion protein
MKRLANRHAAAFALLVFACSKPRDAAPSSAPSGVVDAGPRLARVRVDPSLLAAGRIRLGVVTSRVLGDVRVFPGEVVSDEQGRAEAGTLVSGRVASLDVGVGTAVRKGQTLAWVEAPEVARVAADLIRARVRAEVSSRKEERQRALAADQATSKNALDEAVADARVARADLAAARSLLASLGGVEPRATEGEADPAPLTARVAVRSPLDGVITRRLAVLGGAVAPDTPLFEITARGRVIAVARVPELVADAPPAGSEVTIHPRGASPVAVAECKGRLRGDLGTVDRETRTRALRAEPTAPCAFMVAGAFVSVEIAAPREGHREAVLTVPREAVIDVKGSKAVFVAEDGAAAGAFVLRTVRVGAEALDFVSVDDGLKAGEQIAVEGAPLLKGELLRAELTE